MVLSLELERQQAAAREREEAAAEALYEQENQQPHITGRGV